LHKLLADLTFKYQFKTSPAKMTLTDLQAALKIGIAQREKSLIPLINYLKQQNQKTSFWPWFKT
jgi:hypothetical protein